MKLVWSYLAFHALALAVCFAVMAILSLFLMIPNWQMGALSIWLIVCMAALCFPDSFWESWMGGGRDAE